MRDSQLFDLLVHCEWADATLWRAVLGADRLAADDDDTRLVDWLHHIHMVQHAFAAVWSGAALDLENLPTPDDHEDLEAMARWGRAQNRALQAYLVSCDEVDLARELTFPWAAQMEAAWQHPLQPVTLQQSAQQVAMHSTHHRGQVAARLRELGGEPPALDYIIWLWRDRPAAEWPQA